MKLNEKNIIVNHFVAFRGIKLLIATSVVIISLILFTIVIKYLSEPSLIVSNLQITNITDSSATVTFLTSEPSNPYVVVNEFNNFSIFNQFNKKFFQDDRSESKDRYTHHVTITGLKPNSKYYYKITTGLKNVETDYPSLETAPVLETLQIPSPSYGEFDKDISNDSIVFLQNPNSQILSEVLNESNAFSIDKSNLRDKNFEALTLNKEDVLTFKVINHNSSYVFVSKVGEDQPIDIQLVKSKVSLNNNILGDVNAQYLCGGLGTACGYGGTGVCTPGGCQGEKVPSSSSSSKSSSSTSSSLPSPNLSSSCGGLGTHCGYGGTGTCTPAGCLGEIIPSSSSSSSKLTISECSGNDGRCSGKMIQNCNNGKWTNSYSCDGTTQKCSNASCVEINPSTQIAIKKPEEMKDKTKSECSKLPDGGSSDPLCYKYIPESLLDPNKESLETASKTLSSENCSPVGQAPILNPCCSGLNLDSSLHICISKTVSSQSSVDSKIVNVKANDQNLVGANACGQVSICTSLSGGVPEVYTKCISDISTKGNLAYNQNPNGVNSEDLVNATKKIISSTSTDLVTRNLISTSDEYLKSTLNELSKGNDVIVEVYGKHTGNNWTPTTKSDSSFFHYARVLGVEEINHEKFVILENTINPEASEVIKVKLSDFNSSLLDRNFVNGQIDKGIEYVQIVVDKKVTDKYVTETLIPLKNNGTTFPENGLLKNDFLTTINAEATNTMTVYAGKLSTSLLEDKSSEILGLNISGNSYSGEAKVNILKDGNQIIKFFDDKNGDGVKSDDEPFITEPLEVKLENISKINKIELKEGWNLINVNILNEKIKTANDLLIEISRQGGYATHVGTYRNGKWILFSERAGNKFGVDFNLIPTEGYFIRVYKALSLIIEGNRIEISSPIYINVGWNLLGLNTDKDKKASMLIDGINKTEGVAIDTVTKYSDGRYDNLVKSEGTLYGQDFTIDQNSGYFIRALKAGKIVSSY
ncbi:MAG: fibronectin type III domain-containing protein [bacterium]